MTADAVALITYVWHYLVARVVYDELVRPLSHGRVSVGLLICGVAAAAFFLGRRTGRSRPDAGRRREA